MITAKTVECKHISFDCIIVPKYYSISRKKKTKTSKKIESLRNLYYIFNLFKFYKRVYEMS